MLSNNIAQLRKSKGLTQIDFAKQLHVTQSAVSHWESGRSIPDTVQMFRIAEFFGVSIEELTQVKEADAKALQTEMDSSKNKKAPADDPLTEQIMAKARKMNTKERQALLKLIDIVMEGKE